MQCFIVVPCRMVKTLHIFLLVDGNLALTLQEPTCGLAMLIPDLVSLLILVKSTVKACSMTPDSHVRLVKDMLLMPVGPGQARLNLLQVRVPCALPRHVADLCTVEVGRLEARCQDYSLPVCLCQGHVLQGDISTVHMTANKSNPSQSWNLPQVTNHSHTAQLLWMTSPCVLAFCRQLVKACCQTPIQ